MGGWLVRRLWRPAPTWSAWSATGCRRCELVAQRTAATRSRWFAATFATALLERALGEYEIDTVFHLAAQTIVGIANRNPLSTFESNIRGPGPCWRPAAAVPAVEQIVVASSDKAYGDQEQLPYPKTTPLAGPPSLRRRASRAPT